MRTKLTIMAIVVAAMLAAIASAIALVIAFGLWLGLGVGIVFAITVLAVYRLVARPWHSRWGATDKEVHRSMPGDELVPGAASTTRATTIDAPADEVWPWLVQIGYGRAGWYSYDWIDNDGKRSADRVVAEFQDLNIGDQILMAPGLGPRVKAIEPGRWFVAGGDADSWCLALYPGDRTGTRLVSRWRAKWPMGPATVFWIAVSDPGAFIMERKMLKGIKGRVEAAR